jgi:hypothetical protein
VANGFSVETSRATTSGRQDGVLSAQSIAPLQENHLVLFEAHWADWDQNERLVATVGGRVLSGKLDKKHTLDLVRAGLDA